MFYTISNYTETFAQVSISILIQVRNSYLYQVKSKTHNSKKITILTNQKRENSIVCYSSFPIFRNFLPNPGRILPTLTYNGSHPLNVNTARILPAFSRKMRKYRKTRVFVLKRNFMQTQVILFNLPVFISSYSSLSSSLQS